VTKVEHLIGRRWWALSPGTRQTWNCLILGAQRCSSGRCSMCRSTPNDVPHRVRFYRTSATSPRFRPDPNHICPYLNVAQPRLFVSPPMGRHGPTEVHRNRFSDELRLGDPCMSNGVKSCSYSVLFVNLLICAFRLHSRSVEVFIRRSGAFFSWASMACRIALSTSY